MAYIMCNIILELEVGALFEQQLYNSPTPLPNSPHS